MSQNACLFLMNKTIALYNIQELTSVQANNSATWHICNAFCFYCAMLC